jgi:hypothetical protein
MSTEMTKEEKFFGVSAPLQIPDKETQSVSEPEVELEIVDDLPKQPVKQAEKEENDEELSDYSEKVRKRINKLKYEQHEAQRQKEAAEQMREEAIRFAQQLASKNQQYESLLQRGEGALVAQIKARANLALEQAKALYKDAYEAGDAQRIIDAQEKLLNAQTEFREAERHERVIQSRSQPVQQAYQQPPAPQYQPPQPSPKALEWTKKNPWFGPQGNREMTALAYGVHETLIREQGVKPDTDEYYEKIDSVMRQRFPDYFEKDDEVQVTVAPTQRTPNTVVASASRNNGAKPRKIQLTATQVSVAKRLGLTPEQYAKQLIKESYNG